jgi:dihydrofolate synthase/folylpolyglutamate synthase
MSASPSDAFSYLESLINYERRPPARPLAREFKLSRMRALLQALGDPHLGVPAVHVAGTKGKGSTAAMIAAICQKAGLRTGLYISPHLVSPRERIRINSRLIQRDVFARLIEQVRGRIAPGLPQGRPCPTYFEFLTAVAFTYFRRSRVDVAVMEVGLGGRFDATTVCTPVLCVIAPISHDHTRQLGDDVLSIAREKAGIVARGVPVVLGRQRPYVRRLLRRHCRRVGAPVIEALRGVTLQTASVTPQCQSLTLTTPCRRYPRLELSLLGPHQRHNAVTAVRAAEQLSHRYPGLTPETVGRGLRDVNWSGRTQYFPTVPPVVVDCAHNGASAEALARYLKEVFPRSNLTLVLGVLRDKDIRRMARALLPHTAQLVVTQPHSPRSLPSDTLCSTMINYGAEQPAVFERSDEALAWACQHTPATGLVCVTGSVYLAGEMLSQLHPHFAALAREP